MRIKLKKNINWLELMWYLLILALIIAIVIGFKEYNKKEIYTQGYKTYTVMPNDTIYSIAKDLDTNENLNKVIYEIRQDNQIKDCGNLQIGQELKIREVWN